MGEDTQPNGTMQIDLKGHGMEDELTLKLKRGQVLLINEFLSNNIQPKGYDMIAFAYDLFTRLKNALEQTPVTPIVATEAFGGKTDDGQSE